MRDTNMHVFKHIVIEQIKISTLNSETNLLFLNCEIFKIELKALVDFPVLKLQHKSTCDRK